MLTLVTGGARSGKSRFAQSRCAPPARIGFVATARVQDEDMARRVRRHRKERPPAWTTVEEPLALSRAAASLRGRCDTVLIDCLTLWTTNLLMEPPDAPVDSAWRRAEEELNALFTGAGRTELILVTNEVGSGIVPDTDLCRRFRDLHGWINQHAAAHADEVFLMVSGIPVPIKNSLGER